MIYGNDLLFCNFPWRIVCITFITNAIAVFLCLQQPFFKYLHHLSKSQFMINQGVKEQMFG